MFFKKAAIIFRLVLADAPSAADPAAVRPIDLSWGMLPILFWLRFSRLLELSMYLTVLGIRVIGCSFRLL